MGITALLDEVRKERKANELLLPLLMENLGSARTVSPPGPDAWFSISKVPTLCPRAMVMAHRLEIPLVDEVDFQGRWRMDKGTALHVVIQELWLGPQGWLLGGWQCPRCAHVHGHDSDSKPPFWVAMPDAWVTPQSSVVMPRECEKCKLKWHPINRFQYVEPWVVDEDLLIRGKTDGLLKLPAHYVEFLDIKTTSSLDWVRRKGPRDADVAQLQLYMGPNKCRRGRLMYVDPGAKELEDAIVEYKVDFDPKLMHQEKEKVRGLREALADKTKPIPDCPYGGKLSFGECTCVEIAMFWASHGPRTSS